MTDVIVVVPEIDNGEVSTRLRQLVELLARSGVELAGGLLGGEFGYGAEFQNDVFEMHPYFWGECSCPGADEGNHGDDCPEMRSNFRTRLSNDVEMTVSWYKYIGRGMEVYPVDATPKQIRAAFDRCDESVKRRTP